MRAMVVNWTDIIVASAIAVGIVVICVQSADYWNVSLSWWARSLRFQITRSKKGI